jgi:DNA helicase-2/ATP-dependent DNA helicase PcrA
VAVFKPSPERERVIAHRSGHLRVIACAGTGKTEAISRRIAALIGDGGKPGPVIACTFTERAVESLKNRITKRIADAKGQEFVDRLGHPGLINGRE